MSDPRNYGYAKLEVSGIQRYILETGKLKEMIGGSELIESFSKGLRDAGSEDKRQELFGRLFCEILGKVGITRVVSSADGQEITPPGSGEVLVLQENAGELHALFADTEAAKAFVRETGVVVLREFPGLPLSAGVTACAWDTKAIRDAKYAADREILEQRGKYAPAQGAGMMPLLQAASLDGLPVCERQRDEKISLPSQTRRQDRLLERARRRLTEKLKAAAAKKDQADIGNVVFTDNIEELAGDLNRIAFIHMDGNDLGKLFQTRLMATAGGDVAAGIRRMGELSAQVETGTAEAFGSALFDVYQYEKKRLESSDDKPGDEPKASVKRILMPVRPLVQGGDDVTVVTRADVALLFVKSFIAAFEAQSRRTGEEAADLSMGAAMVICQAGYPFLKAFDLCESLLKNAKKLTAGDVAAGRKRRESSLDWLVITSEVDSDVSVLRSRTSTTKYGEARLTAKPYRVSGLEIADFVRDGLLVLDELPRSQIRPAMNECRISENAGKNVWSQIRRNLERKLGGRYGEKLMSKECFLRLFPEPDGFFFAEQRSGRTVRMTKLGDYLELSSLLPKDKGTLEEYKKLLGIVRQDDEKAQGEAGR